jgi:KDEL-tailed cysteine endopeptidase
MKMGVRAEEGQCGIAMAASYPTKTGPNPSPGPDPGPEPGPAPGPEPVDVECDDSSSCPEKTTCCCANEVFGTCFEWGCCPMPLASCCSDGEHCCPHASVCDLAAGTCRPGVGQFGEVTAWKSKIPATYTKGMAALYNRFFSRFGSKVSKR